ncbi:MAG: cobalt-precorrin-5B (C(1))-methyltransferase [Exilibacterium sp.]
MWPESAEQPRALRSGLTTGCCATACCVAAAQALLDPKRRPEASAPPRAQIVSVKLPRGKTVALTTVVQSPARGWHWRWGKPPSIPCPET